MIRELLIGTAVIGGGGYYVASAYQSADIVRVVKASPHDSWRALDQALSLRSNDPIDISTNGEGDYARPVVTSVDSKEIDLVLDRKGEQLVHVRVRFSPLEGGTQTKMMINADIAGALLPKGMPVPVGNMIFRQALDRLSEQLVTRIESGTSLQVSDAMIEMRRRMDSDPRMGEAKLREREYEQRAAQRAASAPMIDPDKAKLDPRGATVVPTTPLPAR